MSIFHLLFDIFCACLLFAYVVWTLDAIIEREAIWRQIKPQFEKKRS